MTLSFRELQNQLQPDWGFQHVGDGPDVDLLVVPSLSMDRHLIELVTGAHHYEERQLFALTRLRNPGVRAIYVPSNLLPLTPIHICRPRRTYPSHLRSSGPYHSIYIKYREKHGVDLRQMI